MHHSHHWGATSLSTAHRPVSILIRPQSRTSILSFLKEVGKGGSSASFKKL